MWINYGEAITETVEDLAKREKELRGRPTEPRVRMLRLLKSGEVRSLSRCAPLLGYSVTQLTRWWECYDRQGLERLLTERQYRGKPSRLTAEALDGLREVMKQGAVGSLEEARRYLEAEWGISYPSLNGVWYQLRQHRIKLKTGRRRHEEADKEEQAAFKASFRGPAAGAPGPASVRL